jgi:23S rRNA U2552 (ribose-2'-O)-methylase RlmE/FtsJ
MPKLNRDKKYYIGIDIGNKGAIVVLNNLDDDVHTEVMPLLGNVLDIKSLCEILRVYKNHPCHVIIEDLRPLYKVSAKANGSLMFSSGAVEASLVALEIPFTKVSAKVWQKEMFVGVPNIKKLSSTKKTMVNDTKAMALCAAKRLYPKVNLLATKRSKEPHNGIVDALLMAGYCKRKFY